MTDINLAYGTVTDGGGNRTWLYPSLANDGSMLTFARRESFAAFAGTYTSLLVTDLGSPWVVSEHVMTYRGASVIPQSLEYSIDGSTWTSGGGTDSLVTTYDTEAEQTIKRHTWTYDTPVEAQWWRIKRVRVMDVTSYESYIYLATWAITGTAPGGGGSTVTETRRIYIVG